MRPRRGFTLVELLVVLLIIGALAYAFYMYFPQSQSGVSRAAQGFSQELQRARIAAMQTGKISGVWLSENDLDADVAGIQPGYVTFRGNCYSAEICEEIITKVSFDPANNATRTSENIIRGVQPVLWDCPNQQPAKVDGNAFSFAFDASGRYLSGKMTVAFARPAEGASADDLPRDKVTSPIRFIVVESVGQVRTTDESECMKQAASS